MKSIPEEQEAWVQDLKSHWPDPGKAPHVEIPRDTAPSILSFHTGWAVAASVVLLLVAGLILVPSRGPVTASEWPEFNPGRHAALQGPVRSRYHGYLSDREAPSRALSFSIRPNLRTNPRTKNWSTWQ